MSVFLVEILMSVSNEPQKEQNSPASTVLSSMKTEMKQYPPDVMATRLFLVAAGYYQNYNMDDRANHKENMKAMEDIRIQIQDQVRDSIIHEKSSGKMQENIIYWAQTTQNLLKKGDYATAASIRLMIEELEYKKDPNLKKAFATLPSETKEFLNGYKVDDKVTYLSSYENKHVSIPFMGIYSKVLDMAKNAASLQDTPSAQQKENPGVTKLRLFTQDRKDSLNAQIQEEHKMLGSLVDVAANYGKDYENSKNSVDQKKHMAAQILVGFMQNKSLSAEEKVKQLENFIDKIPHSLEHKNFLHRITGADFTIVKMAQQMLPIMQGIAAQEAILKSGYKPEITAAPVSTEVNQVTENTENKFVPGKIPKKPEAQKESNASIETSAESKKEGAVTPQQSEEKQNTAEITSSFKKKLAFFENLQHGIRNSKTALDDEEENFTFTSPK